MTKRAQILRRDMTDAERALWRLIRGDAPGVRFRRQLVIDKRYIVDSCAPETRLVIDVDGGQHADSNSDPLRDAYLAKRGFRVLRVWNHEVLSNPLGVGDRIVEPIAELRGETSPPAPLPRREGGGTARSAPPHSRGRGDSGEVSALESKAT
jgi:very-short-patch-repair endonuclease